LDAVDRYEKDTGVADGWKKDASNMLAAASATKAESRPSVGLGMDLRLESEKLVGFALEHERRVIHICLFPNSKSPEAGNGRYFVAQLVKRGRRQMPDGMKAEPLDLGPIAKLSHDKVEPLPERFAKILSAKLGIVDA
jgi:hypothetical protein